jgi:hypothetical protein
VALSCCQKIKTKSLNKSQIMEVQNNNSDKDQCGNKSKPLLVAVLSSGHKLEFQIQQVVYLNTDKEQLPRIVTGISLRPFNSVTYGLTTNTTEAWHYDFEISDERDIMLCTSN